MTGRDIEYYRNLNHLNQKKSFTEPIVRVPYTKVKLVKKIEVKRNNKVWKDLSNKRYNGVEDANNLYKYIIEVQLKEGDNV